MAKLWFISGSLNAFLSVALGAFGAHGLKERLSADLLQTWETAVHYHQIHALGLILIGALIQWMPNSSLLNWAGALLFAGIVFFSGSLYVLCLTGVRSLGIITPFGGLAFLAGWLVLAVGFFKKV